MFHGCIDRNIESLIRIEETALKRLNDILSNSDALMDLKKADTPVISPNAELFVELNNEKRLTLELEEKLKIAETQLANSREDLLRVKAENDSVKETVAKGERDIARLNEALQRLRQERVQSPTLVISKPEAQPDPVVAILRNRIKFLEEENTKLRNSQK